MQTKDEKTKADLWVAPAGRQTAGRQT